MSYNKAKNKLPELFTNKKYKDKCHICEFYENSYKNNTFTLNKIDDCLDHSVINNKRGSLNRYNRKNKSDKYDYIENNINPGNITILSFLIVKNIHTK